MHVLIIPSWYPTTPEDVDGIFFRQQAQALQRSGIKVGVIAPQFRSLRGEPKSIITGEYGIRHYVEKDIPTYVYKSMYFFPRLPLDRTRWVNAGKKLFERYVKDHGYPDIIHAHCMNFGGILAHNLHEQTGIPYVITEHSSTYARNLVRNWQWDAMHLAAQKCAARIAVSKDFRLLLEKIYRGLEWKYIPNILSAQASELFDFSTKPQNEHFTFCSVAHIQFKKGFDILLHAFAKVLKKYPDIRLKIGGTGWEESKIHELAKQLNLQDSVTFLGGLQYHEVLNLMRQSDAFVLASRHETFGVVFIEALAQGLPIIATRCGGPESIVTNENGLLIPTEDIDALAQAMIDLYENRETYNPESLRHNCINEFGEASVVNRITEEYKNVLSNNQN